ncbi:MAG TPA: hypothetical protein VE776_10070 [Actinomycetota bacterium]|nr:hypothetical protein [Actinomycetota bacterium]
MWRRPDPEVEAAWQRFLRFARALDEGSRALLAAIPSARRPGTPLEASVEGFLAGTAAAREELPGWALPALAAEHAASVTALATAERRAIQLPEVASDLAFEQRTEAIGEVLDELAPIQEAEQAFRTLRRRR